MKSLLSSKTALHRKRLPLALAWFAIMLMQAGCRKDMQEQPRQGEPQESSLFADQRGARPQPAHTVARGEVQEDSFFSTGILEGENGYRVELNVMPYAVTMEMLERGQERFNIYCAPCHSRVGNGMGEVVRRGYKPAANLQDQVRQAQPVSHYYYVITHGYGNMPDYAAQIAPADRWAIAAYVRALQLSQNATMQDLPQGAQVRSLRDLAREENLPESYAGPWTMPPATVQASSAEHNHGNAGAMR